MLWFNREHSVAQCNTAQYHCTKQQNNYVPIGIPVNRTIRAYPYCVPFVFLEHGARGICRSPVSTKTFGSSTYYVGLSFQYILNCERPWPAEPPATRSAFDVETWLLRSCVNLCQPLTNTSHDLPRNAMPVEWKYPLPWRPTLRHDVGTSNRFQ